MRTSQFLLATLKESPTDASIISHKLMLRAGMIRKSASGLYTWLPMGLKVLRKVERIVREEMHAAGALEILMPGVQPSELWKESGRWEEYGLELLRLEDRHGREFCLGPTHEEIITDLVRNELHSYKQLPITLYQIQTKFRDEIRPRFGVMRSREFIMKDAYSFHLDSQSLQATYERMHLAYSNIFTRLGLEFRVVQADSGSIGGNQSHEFHVLADSGEDDIVFSDDSSSSYAANIEKAEAIPCIPENHTTPLTRMQLIDTPHVHTIAELSEQFDVPIEQTVKTLIVHAKEENALIALIIRGDHTLNEIKVAQLEQVATPLTFASNEEIKESIGVAIGSIGPVNLPIPAIVDKSVAYMRNFVAGANIEGKHYFSVNWEHDTSILHTADIRNVVSGDPSPDKKGSLVIKRGIEVGHIFQLGTKYSQALNCQVMSEQGKPTTLTMGCYGIGISRIIAAAIEQNFDEKGIIWNNALAPFTVVLIPLKYETALVRKITDELYEQLLSANIDVLLDDRDKKTSPGIKFADMELIGIPHRLVISERNLASNQIEYKNRMHTNAELISVDEIINKIKTSLS